MISFLDHAGVINQFNKPTDFAFDSEGNLYVCDYFNNRVLMFGIDNRSCTPPSSGNVFSE